MVDVELTVEFVVFLIDHLNGIVALIQEWDGQRIDKEALWVVLELDVGAFLFEGIFGADWDSGTSYTVMLNPWIYFDEMEDDVLTEVLEALNIEKRHTSH